MLKNKEYNQSSDIFHIKNLDKPEYNERSTRTRHNNSSAVDLLAWKRKPLPNEKEEKPIRVHRSPPRMSTQPEPKCSLAKSTTGKRTQSSVVLGTYDQSDFKVKREKDKAYDPSKYFRQSSAYERKYQQLRSSGLNDTEPPNRNLQGEFNSIKSARHPRTTSMGTLKKELQDEKPNFKMIDNYHNNELPGNEGERKRGKLMREMMHQNSTGNYYDKNQIPKANKVNMLKSNIFNDPDWEKLNSKDSMKVAREEQKAIELANERPTKTGPRTNRINKDNENFISNLDWKNSNTNLYFKGDEDIDKKPIERKMNELYGGVDPNKVLAEPKTERDQNLRNNLLNKYTTQNPTENVAKIKKKLENMAYYQNPQTYNNNPTKKSNNVSTEQQYELKNFENSNNVNLEDVEKTFRSKGLHIYGLKNETGVGGYQSKGRITFKIRNNENNKIAFNKKLNDAKRELKEKNGYDVGNYVSAKKPK